MPSNNDTFQEYYIVQERPKIAVNKSVLVGFYDDPNTLEYAQFWQAVNFMREDSDGPHGKHYEHRIIRRTEVEIGGCRT